MLHKKIIFLTFSLLISHCFAHEQKSPLMVHTAYGDFQVTEPALLDLFASPAMERLKGIHQYGISDYVKEDVHYSRYEHSVGVWALLRHYGASLNEQIAGLLHDASHTVFSHVADFLFGDYSAQDSYQDDIHLSYLEQQGVGTLLATHGITLQDIDHKKSDFKRLEQSVPDLCADRIEYNLKAGVLIGYIKKDEIKDFMADLCFDKPTQRWYFKSVALAKRFSEIPLYNSLHVWGGPDVFVINTLSAKILKRAMECNLLTHHEIHYSTDDVIWTKICASNDKCIQNTLASLKDYKKTFVCTSEKNCDHVVKTKFRGFNPWVKTNDGFARLTDLDPTFHFTYDVTKQLTTRGWPIQWLNTPAIE